MNSSKLAWAVVVFASASAAAAPRPIVPLPENLVPILVGDPAAKERPEADKQAKASYFEVAVGAADVPAFVTLGAYDAKAAVVHLTATPTIVHLANKLVLAPSVTKPKPLADLDLAFDPDHADALARQFAAKTLDLRLRVALKVPLQGTCDACKGMAYDVVGWKLQMIDGTIVFASNFAPLRPASASSCDEVGCTITNYEGACCDKYRKAKVPPPGPMPDGPPESLDRQMIVDGVNQVKPAVMKCGGGKGVVKVSIRVGADGKVAEAIVKEAPTPQLGDCVAQAMQKATYPRTRVGGSFTMPFVF